MAYVNLTSKFVDVGSTGGFGFALYGYRNVGGSYGTFGTLSETANGSSNDTTSNLYSTSTQILQVYFADQTTDTLYLTLAGNRANSGWTRIVIGSSNFTRSSATYSYDSTNDRTTWSWVTSTNPFGTTNGADVAVNIQIDLNTGHTGSISLTSLSATATTTAVYTLSNASSTKYRLIKETGTTPSVSDGGTVNSRTGSGTINIPTSGLPTAGNTATYQLQIGGPNSQTSDNDAWIDTTGSNNSFSISRSALAGPSDAPVSRDHALGDYIAMNNGTAQYVTSEPGTVIKRRRAGVVSTLVTTGNNPQRGSISYNQGDYIYTDNTAKPVVILDQGAHWTIVPTSLKGQKFGHYANRSNPGVFYFHSRAATTVQIYQNVTGGITGTSTSSFALAASTVQTVTLSANAQWVFFTSAGVDMNMTARQQSNDRSAIGPMGDIVYRRKNDFERTENNTAPSIIGTSHVSDASLQVTSLSIGDGSGGDNEQGLADVNLSETYMFMDRMYDFVLAIPNSATVVCEYYAASAWNLAEVFTGSGTATSPTRFVRGGATGFGVAGSTNSNAQFSLTTSQIWRWRGTDVFYLGLNDSGKDEETMLGYTATYVAPTGLSRTSDGAASASVQVTLSTATAGSGGALKYAQSTTSTPPSTISSWQTSNIFRQDRGTTRYYFASQSENRSGTFASVSSYIGYKVGDGNVTNTVSASTLNATGTSDVTSTISNGNSSTVYRIVNNSNTSTVYASRTGNGAMTLDHPGDLPTAGNSIQYRLQYQRPTSTGGDGIYRTASPGTFTISRGSSTGADVDVDMSFEEELGNEVVSVTVTGGRGGTGTFANPVLLDAGDTVRFRAIILPGGFTDLTVSSFAAASWTSTAEQTVNSGVYTNNKTWKSGQAGGAYDNVRMRVNGTSTNRDVYFAQVYPQPDLTISFCSAISISANATTHTINIANSGDSTHSASTRYFVNASNRLGPGNLTVNSVPTFLGQPRTYAIQGALPTGAGGNSAKLAAGTYTVTRGVAPGANGPDIDDYGIAIYDHQENFVTSFTDESTVLREIVAGTALASNSQCTNIALGVTGLSSNALALLTSDGDETGQVSGTVSIPTRFVGGNTLQIARKYGSSASVNYTVLQFKGRTVGPNAPDYGVEIYNKQGDLVVDEFASFYAVKEIMSLSSGQSSVTHVEAYESDGITPVGFGLVRVELTEGDYPFSGGLPIPAVQGPGLALLMPPQVLSAPALTYSSSYRYVTLRVLDAQYDGGSNWKLAMLTERQNTQPSYFGGSASDYGVQIKDSAGNINWDSSWRQCIVNNVINANQFGSGSSKNSTYDVTSGFDGVDDPPALSLSPQGTSDFYYALHSTAGGKSLTGLNDMDPQNTFLLGGGLVNGQVIYYQGRYFSGDFNIDTIRGGGTHIPGITITGNTTATISMPRVGEGTNPPSASDYCARDPRSHHPDGFFVLARIT